MKHPDPTPNIASLYPDPATSKHLEDSFIEIGRRISNAPVSNYFAVTNGTPAIESKFAVAGTPEEILKQYIIEFRRCDYPFTLIRIDDKTYSFTGTVGTETKKNLLVYDPAQDITVCNCTCETKNYDLLQKCQITIQRFPELSQLPGEIVYIKEYHQGPVISICAKIEFKGNATLAMDEVTARFTQHGWKQSSSKIINHQNFSKEGASARISAIEGKYNSTALIVISDQSQLLRK